MNIQWYPGHMAKTRRQISESLRLVDVVAELLDARIPFSSRNPDIASIVGEKPRVVVLNKSDMAQQDASQEWVAYYKSQGVDAVLVDSISGRGMSGFHQAVDGALAEKYRRDAEKGMKKRPARIMILGIPNVGKSSFINKLSKRAGTRTGDRPGVTREKQWIRISGGYELLDTPGILWPRFDDPETGLRLAFTGAVKDEVYDTVELAGLLCAYLAKRKPGALADRYRLPLEQVAQAPGYAVLEEIGKKRGCLIRGGEVDTQRAAGIILDEFRGTLLGPITLEHPQDADMQERERAGNADE